MAKAGRKTVMTDETVRKIEEVAALDGSVEEMAYYAGIHVDTIYAHLKSNPKFSDRIRALRERPVLQARQTVVNAIKTDPNHAFKYLEKKRKKEFGAAIDITSDGKSIGPSPEAQELADRALERFLNQNGSGNNKINPPNITGQ